MINVLNIAALMAIMLAMGLKVTSNQLLQVAKDRALVGRAMVANFVIVPVVTYVLLRFLNTESTVSAGFLVLAVCPGAPIGPLLTDVAKGSVSTAVGLMLILACLSSAISPVLLIIFFDQLFPHSSFRVDTLGILKTLLIVQVFPLAAGLVLRKCAPSFAVRIAGLVDKLSKILLVIVLTALIATQYRALSLLRFQGCAGMLLLFLTSLATGWFCAREDRSIQKALSLLTATRNAGVALIIVMTAFPGTAAAPAVVVYTLFSTVASLVAATILKTKTSSYR